MKKTFIYLLFFIVTSTTVFADKASDAYNQGDYKTAYRLWEPEAQAGEAYAQYNLGLLYAKGNGVIQDYKQAAYWSQKAANQGYSTAQYNLGLLYAKGNGVIQDYKQAVYWYQKAANQGYSKAQYNLGVLYAKGNGVIQDYKQAVYWYQKAANQGYSSAQFNLGILYKDGNGVTQDYKQAVYWYQKAANQGDSDAQFNLGVLYAKSNGVIQDYKQAAYWYQKAANQGRADAQNNLGLLYDNGNGVTQDNKQAANLYLKAAEQGDTKAIRNVQILLAGLGFDIGPADGIYGPKTRALAQQYLNASDSKDIYVSSNLPRNKILDVKNASGKLITSFQNSYALIIGASNYTHGWSKLPSVVNETRDVKIALQKKGFKVTHILNPDNKALVDSFKNFINKYGYEEQNRLLFFFSGHGHSRKNHKKGYLVPTNAPDPRKDKKGFLEKALSMTQILSWSREIEAKHALFLFDSCFSGALFKSKSRINIPLHITDLTARPVRQYITAGDAGETVPAKSVFAPAFIKALRGEADLSNDGYITGSELGAYLHDKVIDYRTGQTPQYGKIRDPDLDEGDFVFSVK